MTLFQRIRNSLLAMGLGLSLLITIIFGLGVPRTWAATLSYQPPLALVNHSEAMNQNLEGGAQTVVGQKSGDADNQRFGKAKQAKNQLSDSAGVVKKKVDRNSQVNAVINDVEDNTQTETDMTNGNAPQKTGKITQSGGLKKNMGWLTF